MVSDNDEDRSTSDQGDTDAAAEDAGQQPAAEEWADLAEAGPKEVKPGDILEGVVAGFNNEGVSVDLGAKLEGLIPRGEFASEADLPKVDDRLEVAVVRIDDEAGIIKLSKRRADFARTWNRLEEAAQAGELVDAMVTERIKGGLRVDVGVPGFVPASQVGTRDVRDLERYVGRSLRLKVLEADRRSKKVILSHRQVVEQEREKRRAETMAKLEEGTVVEGKVRNLTNYGAFVDLGGVDGLLHVSEMSWTRINDPADVLTVGETIQVTVLEIDPETDKISLSRRQILPDPWKEAARKLRPGQLVKARIVRLVRTGAFAALEDSGIEGFIPISEMSSRRIADPSEVLKEGQEVDLRISDIRVEARRMTLSLSGAEQEKERQEYKAYMNQQQDAPVTLGDRFGALFQQLEISADVPSREEVQTDKEAAAAVHHYIEGPDEGTAAEQQNLEATASELAMTEEQALPDEYEAVLEAIPADNDTEAEALDHLQPEEPAEDEAAEAEAEAAPAVQEAAAEEAAEDAAVEELIEEALVEQALEEAAVDEMIEEMIEEALIEEALLEEAVIEQALEEAAVEEMIEEALIAEAMVGEGIQVALVVEALEAEELIEEALVEEAIEEALILEAIEEAAEEAACEAAKPEEVTPEKAKPAKAKAEKPKGDEPDKPKVKRAPRAKKTED